MATEYSEEDEFVDSTEQDICGEEEIVVFEDSGEHINCVIQKVLLTPSHPISPQRHNLFKTCCTIKQRRCEM